MKLIEIKQTENGEQAVQCSELYKVLGLAPQNYSRWINRNILKNRFALIDVDYSNFTLPSEEQKNIFTSSMGEIRNKKQSLSIKNYDTISNKTNDFILTLDFAKKLSMLTRTEKGEQVRNYFLKCEKIALRKKNDENNLLIKELNYYRRLEQIKSIRQSLNTEVRNIRKNISELIIDSNNQLALNI